MRRSQVIVDRNVCGPGTFVRYTIVDALLLRSWNVGCSLAPWWITFERKWPNSGDPTAIQYLVCFCVRNLAGGRRVGALQRTVLSATVILSVLIAGNQLWRSAYSCHGESSSSCLCCCPTEPVSRRYGLSLARLFAVFRICRYSGILRLDCCSNPTA